MNKIVLFFSVLIVLLSGNAFAGKNDTLQYPLDYWFKKCEPHQAHYIRVAFKEGDWWHVQDIYAQTGTLYKDGLYSDDSMTVGEGMIFFYHPNGKLEKKARHIKGKLEGLVKIYDTAGHLVDSGIYSKGIPKKARYKWDSDGKLVFKGEYDEEGYGVGHEWEYYADGKISAVGNTAVGAKRDSIWTFYYPTGVMSAQDFYDKGSKMGRICYDEKGEKYEATCEDAPAQPVEKPETINGRFSQRYSDMKESNYKINQSTGSMSGTFDQSFRFKKGTYIVLKVYVDEKGKMTKIDVPHGVHPQVDKQVVDIFTGITKFKPRMDGNRAIASSFEWSFPLAGF